jgi:hypothetical protein
MTIPSITASYLGALGLLYAFLGLRVARFRRGNKIAFGDGDNRYLRSAIRAHANFAEYVPIIVIMNALLEMGRRGVGADARPAWNACGIADPASLRDARKTDDAAIHRRPDCGGDTDVSCIARISAIAAAPLRALLAYARMTGA